MVYAGASSLPFWAHWKVLVPDRRLPEDIWRQLGHAWAAEGPLKFQLGAELDRLGPQANPDRMQNGPHRSETMRFQFFPEASETLKKTIDHRP